MEENKKRRSILNLFDIVVILVALALAAVLLIPRQSASDSPDAESGTVRYTIELTGMQNGSAELIQEGDSLVDRIKRYSIGTVQSVEVTNTLRQVEDYENGVVRYVESSTLQTAILVIEAPCTQTDTQITVSGGYAIRVGLPVSVLGPGYYGTGYILAVERGQ